MEKEEIKNLLDQLAEFKSQRSLIDIWKQEAISRAMPPSIVKMLEDIEAEFSTKAMAVDENIASLEVQIKEKVLEAGETIQGEFFDARFNKGRTSWDTPKLEGMAKLIPELLTCRKVGEPYISITPKKG